MFNVLPEKLKNRIKNEYRMRFWIIACMFVIFVEVISLFLLFPSWILSMGKERQVVSDIATIEDRVNSFHTESQSQTVTTTNRILHIINNNFTYPFAIPLFDTIISNKNSQISISGFSYVSSGSTSATILLTGISETREALVSFVKQLKSSGSFTTVDLPVSNLAKDTQIEFSITITVSPKS